MKQPVVPTKATALASGVFLGFAMPMQEALTKSIGASAQVQQVIFLFALVVCFFWPALVFVVGTQCFSFGWRDLGAKSYWAELGHISVRALCWLLGAGTAFATLVALNS